MKLQQGQIWQLGTQYYRITHLERLDVQYKLITDMVTRKGTHHHVTKKDFCRLIKNAVLLPASQKEPQES